MLCVANQIIRYPDGRNCDFEVIDQKGSSVLVFIWNTTDQTTTLIEEFAPGHLELIIGPVAGGVSKSIDLWSKWMDDDDVQLCVCIYR